MASFAVGFSARSRRVDQVGQQPQCVGGVPTVGHLGDVLGQPPKRRGQFTAGLRIEARQLFKQTSMFGGGQMAVAEGFEPSSEMLIRGLLVS